MRSQDDVLVVQLFVTDDGREHALKVDLLGDVLRFDLLRLIRNVQVAVLHVFPAVLVHDRLQIWIVYAQYLLHKLSLDFLVGDVDQVDDVWGKWWGGEDKIRIWFVKKVSLTSFSLNFKA